MAPEEVERGAVDAGRTRAIRVMKADAGRPLLGESATTLGVRGRDIELDREGMLAPGRGGMSVRPCLEAYPTEWWPKRLRAADPVRWRDATGANNLRVFRLGQGEFVAGAINDRLALAPDSSAHGVIEPAERMTEADYRAAVSSTRDEWVDDEP